MNVEHSIRLIALIGLGTLLLGAGIVAAQTAQPLAQKSSAPQDQPAAPVRPALEPKAVDLLKAVSTRLAGAHTLSFTAVETYESLSRQGVPVIFANEYHVTLQRPNKLRVILTGDGPASEFYYDGKVMMAYTPAENLIAIADAPKTIDKMLETIYHTAAMYFPFYDLIVSDPYGDLAPGLQHAYYIGQSKIVGGITTDILAYAGDGVFVQMWLGAEDKLPLVMHAIFLDDPDRLRHNLLLSDWQIDPQVTDDFFTTPKATTAKHMEFARPRPETPPGFKPTVGPPAKTSPATSPAKSN